MLRPHTRAVRQLLTDFDFFIEDIGPLNLFKVSSRLKDYHSATRKSERLGITVENIHDLAGIRIVVATENEVEVVAGFFHRGEASTDLEVESDTKISREDGYRARHIVAVVQPRYTRSARSARVEIQLLTVLQHAFNFMSRAWVYKVNSALSPEWQARFAQFAKGVRKQDKLANMLHSEVLESATVLADDTQLTPMSYQRLVRRVFAEDLSLDAAVDYCRMIVDAGCRTNGDVRSFFEDERIEAIRREFGRSPSPAAKSWANIVGDMPRHAFWMMFGIRYDVTRKLLSEGSRDEPGSST